MISNVIQWSVFLDYYCGKQFDIRINDYKLIDVN